MRSPGTCAAAPVHDIVASRRIGASGLSDVIRRFASAGAFLRKPGCAGFHAGDCGEQILRVRMRRTRDHLRCLARFNHAAPVKDHQIAADLVGGREIVGDVDKGDSTVHMQSAQTLDNRRTHRGVHHGHRFIGDHDPRMQKQGACNGNALALASAELVRVTPQDFRRAQSNTLNLSSTAWSDTDNST